MDTALHVDFVIHKVFAFAIPARGNRQLTYPFLFVTNSACIEESNLLITRPPESNGKIPNVIRWRKLSD